LWLTENVTRHASSVSMEEALLIEKLFSAGIMQMGSSRVDPGRQVGVFNPAFISSLPALRASEMEKIRWLVGDWNHENVVPATRLSPAYTDIGTSSFSMCEDGNCICLIGSDGRQTPNITFDPISRQWIYMLLRGSYGMLRSPQGWVGEKIVFSGLMTMIGIDCEWRMTWTKEGVNRFAFINEERTDDGSWAYIDEWRFSRKR
jgi:hypothetical protein